MCGAEAEQQAEAVQIFFPLGGAIHAVTAGFLWWKMGMAEFPPKKQQICLEVSIRLNTRD